MVQMLMLKNTLAEHHCCVRRVALQVLYHPLLKEYVGRTPLLYASAAGHYNIVQVLLNSNADINATDLDGRTALINAMDNGRDNIFSLLIEKGADVNKGEFDRGETPLHWAAKYAGRLHFAKMLLEKGADIKAEDDMGSTPLDYAVEAGNKEFQKLLKKSQKKWWLFWK
jgi:ankyrin repeat protein